MIRITLCAALVCVAGIAVARDDGRYAQSPLKKWFEGLRSQAGASCCDGADGFRVEDPDWETKDGKYRVRLQGQWIDVPDGALITVPNKLGQTMVWPFTLNGVTIIRCFLRGAMG